jgi:RNA polymerase sigma-70 factor, ECF subfamily
LVFNEGYAASQGASLIRIDLTAEALRLGRLLLELLPDPKATGLLALMLLDESRREVRVSKGGEIILLEDQERSRWDQKMISEGTVLVEQTLQSRNSDAYTVQAAKSAVHSKAANAAQTDWNQIVVLYSVLLRIDPSPVVELNRAGAVAMRDGPEAGLVLIDAILERRDLADYHLAHAARAELCRRSGKMSDAKNSYERALSLARQEPERRYLTRRLSEI